MASLRSEASGRRDCVRQRSAKPLFHSDLFCVFAIWKNPVPLLFLPEAQAGVSLGPMVLVFGCRRESMDLLRKETDKLGCVLSRWSKDWSPMIKILMLDDRWSRDCYFTDPQNRGDDEGWLGGCLPSRAPRWLLTIEKVTLLCFFRNFGHWYKSYFWSSFFWKEIFRL